MKSRAFLFLFSITAALGIAEIFFTLNFKFFHFQLTDPAAGLTRPSAGVELPPAAVEKIQSIYNSAPTDPERVNERVQASRDGLKNYMTPMSIIEYMSYRGNGAEKIEKFKAKLVHEPTGLTIYDVEYGLNSRRIRKTTVDENSEGRRPILLLGCSLTFGQGVDDRQTIASYLQKLRPDDDIFNMGIPGSGLNDVLDDFTKSDRTIGLFKNKGVAIYSYFGFHNERTFCLNSCYSGSQAIYLERKTDYEIENGELRDRGPFPQSRGSLHGFLNLVYKTRIGTLFMNTFFNPNSAGYQQRFAKLMKKLEKILADRGIELLVYVPNYDIYVYNQKVIDTFKAEGLKVIYLADRELVRKMDSRSKIAGDGHYNPAGNEAQAIYINELLKANGY